MAKLWNCRLELFVVFLTPCITACRYVQLELHLQAKIRRIASCVWNHLVEKLTVLTWNLFVTTFFDYSLHYFF